MYYRHFELSLNGVNSLVICLGTHTAPVELHLFNFLFLSEKREYDFYDLFIYWNFP